MSRNTRAWFVPLAAAAIVLSGPLSAPLPASAGGVVDPAPIGPDQYFVGEVNGQTAGATIEMGCFGPVYPGKTGHPLDGQTVEVLPRNGVTPTPPGYTGSAAHSVGVSFGLSSSSANPVVLSAWAVPGKVPSTLVLPCYGTGTVTFAPVPTSDTARSATVQVTFASQP